MLAFLYPLYVETVGDEVMSKEFPPLVTASYLLFIGLHARRGLAGSPNPALRLQVTLSSNQGDAKSKRPTPTFTLPLQTHSASHSFPLVICKKV